MIRIFNLPTINEVNQYGDTYDGRNYCIGQWSENIDEAYWDISHHPYSVNNIIYFLTYSLEYAAFSELKWIYKSVGHKPYLIRQLGKQRKDTKLFHAIRFF